MANLTSNLLELDVNKLFEEHVVGEIIEVEKLLDADIERKRVELRGMVGDRYKDVLTASDAIKSMKITSERIVEQIQRVADSCATLAVDTSSRIDSRSQLVNVNTVEERTIIIQIRLAMLVSDAIWMALEQEDFLNAAQFYLLNQHIHTGLQLLSKEILCRLPILKRMKYDADSLKSRILKCTKEKLRTIQLSTESASNNLSSLMILERFQQDLDLFLVFVDLRKASLAKVITEPHASVRLKVIAILTSIVSTVYLFHECFINFQNTQCGHIWQQLENIVGEGAASTLSTITLPITPLDVYIPDIIKQFRPKWTRTNVAASVNQMQTIIAEWLTFTSLQIKTGLQSSLDLITNLTGLHIIREEALKIDLPEGWEGICEETHLPKNFQPWLYFFQTVITNRAKAIITQKISSNTVHIQNVFAKTVDIAIKSGSSEGDLRWYIWTETDDDVSRSENKHLGVTMKAKGYSPTVVKLCMDLDQKYLELLKDLSLYFYGVENDQLQFSNNTPFCDQKHVDRNELEEYLKRECRNSSHCLTLYLEEYIKAENDRKMLVIKSLISSRLLLALCELCPSFMVCCSCNGSNEEWETIGNHLSEYSMEFYENWLEYCVAHTETVASNLENVQIVDMLHTLPRWDDIEIQEQTEEKVFKSQIKVPSQASLFLQGILKGVNNELSAVIPHTIPKQLHLRYIDEIMKIILQKYENLADRQLNQTQALQFLFDVKYLTSLCIPRENIELISKSQSICDKFRSKIDPFDLDVFYSYVQNNVRNCVLQSRVILGCLLPGTMHLASLGMFEKYKDLDREPSVLAVSVPSSTSWFPLLPVTTPVQKTALTAPLSNIKANKFRQSDEGKKSTGSVNSVRSGAVAFFGAMTNEWFS